MSKKEIEEAYAISRRIEGEERALEAAVSVTTSTQQEIDEQWNLYDGCALSARASAPFPLPPSRISLLAALPRIIPPMRLTLCRLL